MNNKTLNVDVDLKGFDFNKLDMQFFQRQVASIYQKHMLALSETLRWWSAERMANPANKVNYQLRISSQANSVLVNGMQYFDLVDAQNEPQISIILATGGHAQSLISGMPLSNNFTGVEMLAEYDREYNAKKTNLPSELKSAYYSLRNVLAQTSRFATGCYIGANNILFITNEGDISHVVKVVTGHLFSKEEFK